MSSSGILGLKRGTSVIVPLFGVILSVLMLPLMTPCRTFLLPPLRILVTTFLPTYVRFVCLFCQRSQVYVRRKKSPIAELLVPPSLRLVTPDLNSPKSPIAPTLLVGPASLPIALHKGKQSCTSHPIAYFVFYNHLSLSLRAFTMSVTCVACVPTSMSEALSFPCWRDEMTAKYDNGTWELVSLLTQKSIVGYHLVFTMTYLPDGTVEHYKGRLVAKGYT